MLVVFLCREKSRSLTEVLEVRRTVLFYFLAIGNFFIQKIVFFVVGLLFVELNFVFHICLFDCFISAPRIQGKSLSRSKLAKDLS